MSLRTRPEDCQQKIDFKMETLNIQTIFADTSGTTSTQHYPKT
jgi:hypothetical protein